METQEINQPQPLPNATAVLVLGILSIVFCCGIIGLALGIVAIVLASKENKLYLDSSNMYTESSYKNMKSGKICAIIGVCLSSLSLLFFLIYFLMFGAILSALPWVEMMEQSQGY